MFKRIHWICTSPDRPTRAPENGSLHIKVHCILIKYENGKAKLAYYPIQLINLNDPNDQQREWFLALRNS